MSEDRNFEGIFIIIKWNDFFFIDWNVFKVWIDDLYFG